MVGKDSVQEIGFFKVKQLVDFLNCSAWVFQKELVHRKCNGLQVRKLKYGGVSRQKIS